MLLYGGASISYRYSLPPSPPKPTMTKSFSLLICCCLTALVHAGDWPEFRGPTAQGIYEGKELPTQWDAGRNIAWKRAIPGLGWSSPAVVDGRIYLTTATPGTV